LEVRVMSDLSWLQSSPASVVEAGVHTPGVMRRHADRVLPVHELIVVQSGVLPIAEEDRRFTVGRNQWVLLRAGRRHFGYEDLDDDTWFCWVCFGSGWSDEVDGMGARVVPAPSEGSVLRPERLRRLFEDLLEDQQEGNLTRAASLGYLQLMLAEILNQPPVTVAQGTSVQVGRRTAGFIADHLTEPDLSTAAIAAALGFNADYLGRAFRAAFNETPTEHIHRLRIDRARMLFRSTNRSIHRVAAEVGFNDDRYFRRIFKRTVGLTPRQFQRLRPSG
jgi:AraC-like DNA-binding protein